MDENAPVTAPSPASQCVFAKCSRCFLLAQAIQAAMVLAMIGLRWCWKRYHQRETPLLHIPPPLQEDLNEVQDVTTELHVSRLPYSEDTIVNIISDIYRIYLQLNYISDWEVTWAPPEGHKINQALCEELHIDPVVISLMKRLPYFRFSRKASDVEFIYRWSRAFTYLQDYEIRAGRDPNWVETDNDPRSDVLLPHELALTCSTDEGCHLILDTKENTIRVWDLLQDSPSDDDYRQCHPHHAPTYLASHLQRVRSLEIIPNMTRYPCDLVTEENDIHGVYPQIKKILQEQYGWPYDFREAEWKAVSKVTWARISRQDPTYETDREDEFEPEFLKNGGYDSSYDIWYAFESNDGKSR